MAKRGANPIVVVGFTYASALGKVAKEFPNIQWGIVDDSSVQAPNVQGIVFKEEEGSYLVGLAAAMTTKTGRIGFIGGVNTPLIAKFEAGYIAGAKAIFIPVFEGLKSAFDKIRSAIDNNKESFQDLFEFLRKYVAPFVGGVLKLAIEGLGTAISTVINLVGNLIDGFRTLISLGSKIGNFVSGVFGGG